MAQTRRERPEHALARNLAALAAFSFFTYPFAIVPLIYFLMRDRGITKQEYATLYLIYYLGQALLELPTGWLADRVGRRLPMILGPAILSVGFVVMFDAQSFGDFALAQALLALGHALLNGPPSALLFEALAEHGRQDDYLRQESRMATFRTGGTAASFLLGGLLAYWRGIPDVVLATAALCTFAGIAALFLREPARKALPHDAEPKLWPRLRKVLARPEVRWILVLYTLVFFLLRYGFHTYQPWLEAAREEGPLLVAGLYTSFAVVALPFTRLAPWIRDKCGGDRVLGLLPFLSSISLIGLSFTAKLALAPLFYLQQIPFGLHWSLVHSYTNHRIPSRDRALVLSSLSFAGRVGFALSFPFVFGSAAGVESEYLIVGIVTLAAAVLVAALQPGRGKAKEVEGEG